MSDASRAAKAHDARHAIIFAAVGAVLIGAGLSAATALRSSPALASVPHLPGSQLGRTPSLASILSRGLVQQAQAQAVAPAAPFILKAANPAERARAIHCLADAVYYEAALEPEDGQRAVAQVVLNRVRDPNFPKSVCGVVFQGWNQPPGCQFSFTCDGSLLRAPLPGLWRRAEDVAEQALNGYVMAEVGTATHYHTSYVSPWWKTTVVKIAQVGLHIFYRWPGSAGLPGAFTGHYAGGEFRISDAVLSGRAQAAVKADASKPEAPLPGAAPVQKVLVADASAPGGVVTRVHSTIMLPGARPTPTAQQVAQINAELERRFPQAGPPAPAVAQASKPAAQHVQAEPAAPAKPAAAPAPAKAEASDALQTARGD